MQQIQFNQLRPMNFQPRIQAQSTVSKERNSLDAKNGYANLYKKAINDKINQQLRQQQIDQQNGKSVNKNGINYHTPSSASIQVSILELIQYVLREYEQTNPVMLKPTTAKDSYTMYEDLKVIFSLGSTEDQISRSMYQKLADEGYVNRSYESIRSRYLDYLKYLDREDFQKILSYIDQFGLNGYLIFEKHAKGGRFLQRIQKQDPRQQVKENQHPNVNQQQNGQGQQNVSASHTPSKSPNRINKEQPNSSNIFPTSPYRMINNPQLQNPNNFIQYYYPQYPYPIYPPPQQMIGGDSRISPFKQQIYYDPQTQQQVIIPPPYFMNPYMYGGNPFANQVRYSSDQMNSESNNEEHESYQYEVRPSQKKTSAQKQKGQDMEDEDEISENIMKKKKNNDTKDQKKVSQSIPQDAPIPSNKQQKPQNLETKQTQKIQSTLILPNFQGIQMNKQKFMVQQGGLGIESELKQQPQSNKPLTKEVYDLISDDDRIPENQFESMIEYVSKQINMPKEQVVDILDSLSGSFEDFSIYLKTKQDNMLWNAQEDKILSEIQSKDSQSYYLLTKLKKLPSIKRRILYNNINFPFSLE